MSEKIDIDLWKAAQEKEFHTWHQIRSIGKDDWNKWWRKEFDNYSFLKGKNIGSVMEVGCGPYANNISYVIEALDNLPSKIALSDPLLDRYIADGQPVKQMVEKMNAKIYTSPLENLTLYEKDMYNCVICINVLRHVYDIQKCMDNIFWMLNMDGYIIFAEDLTHEDEPLKTDEMHPVWFNEEQICQYLNAYDTVFYKTLDRQHGRNPDAHYKTVLFCGQK